MSAARFVQKRMPTRSSVSPLIVSRVRASFSIWTPSRGERRRHVVVVVVVAEDAEDAVRRRQRRERLGRRADVLAIAPRHVVAAEHDEIRAARPSARDRASDVVVRDPAAAVDVGEQADAQARPARAAGRRPARRRA